MATELLRYTNDVMAEMVARSNGQLPAPGAVPLQDMDRAIAELHRPRPDLEIDSNVNRRPIRAPELAPFFCAARSICSATARS